MNINIIPAVFVALIVHCAAILCDHTCFFDHPCVNQIIKVNQQPVALTEHLEIIFSSVRAFNFHLYKTASSDARFNAMRFDPECKMTI